MTEWQKILVAVDDSTMSDRVVDYVGKVVVGHQDVEICLLQVYPEPPPYFYQQGHNLNEFQQEKENTAHTVFKRLLPILFSYGLSEEMTQTRCLMAEGTSLSNEILKVREDGNFGTLALGRRGISKAEEFLFGSISSAILRESHDFTVWVVS